MKLECKDCGAIQQGMEYLGTNTNVEFYCQKCHSHNFYSKVVESLLSFTSVNEVDSNV